MTNLQNDYLLALFLECNNNVDAAAFIRFLKNDLNFEIPEDFFSRDCFFKENDFARYRPTCFPNWDFAVGYTDCEMHCQDVKTICRFAPQHVQISVISEYIMRKESNIDQRMRYLHHIKSKTSTAMSDEVYSEITRTISNGHRIKKACC